VGWTLGAPSTAAGGTAASRASSSPTAASTQPVAIRRRVALYGDGMLDGNGLADQQALPVLLSKARPDLLVIDLGLGHETSDKVGFRIRDATQARPDVVVVWAGSYDAAGGLSPQKYASDMGSILDALKGTQVILLPPVGLSSGGGDVTPYAVILNKVAAQHGVTVTDITEVMTRADWQDGGQDLGSKANAALAALLGKML
jgi:hypothetical protein